MNFIHIQKNKRGAIRMPLLLLLLCTFIASCDFGYDLPEANSIPDATPPSAAFDFKPNDADFLTVEFTNLSGSSTDYSWDFGDDATSTDEEPNHTYAEVGTYTVTLVASDKLGATSTSSKEVVVEEPVSNFVPVVLEGSFEDNSLPDGSGDGRDSWRNELGGVIQITSSPVHQGAQAAKLPSAGDRVGYQSIAVLPDTDYRLSFHYTMKSDPGTLTVSILDSEITDLSEAAGATIASVALTDNSSPDEYVNVIIPFNSGDQSVVGILFTNTGSECRLDAFEFIE
ncbi:MAG: PKD domain-containing protein [Bacteroidota bacterium]